MNLAGSLDGSNHSKSSPEGRVLTLVIPPPNIGGHHPRRSSHKKEDPIPQGEKGDQDHNRSRTAHTRAQGQMESLLLFANTMG